MYLANIITDEPIQVKNNLIKVITNDNLTIDSAIPTLVIGLENVKKISNNLSYTNRKLSETLFWTFTKKEKRQLHDEDIYNFISSVYNKIKKTHTYEYFDFFIGNEKLIGKKINHLLKSGKLVSFMYNEMVYLYIDKYIYGVNLNQLIYLEKDVNKLINKIKTESKVFLENNEIIIEYKGHLDLLDNEVKYVPALYSIIKNE
jgi:hypothetical protein